jgi:DNA-binding GntR family transcriptional regulator
LIALEREGWVRIENYRGAYVSALSPQTIEDHFELAGVLYEFGIRRAMERAPEQFIDRVVALESDLAQTTDRARIVELIYNFYATIENCARSPRLEVVLRAISSLTPGDFFEAVPVAIDLERKSIATVVSALRGNDTDRAAAELRGVLRQAGKALIQLFGERGLFAVPEQAN